MNWGKTNHEREMKAAKKAEWHRWFAWHPVRLQCGVMVWLAVVERYVSCEDFLYDIEVTREYRGVECKLTI